MDEEPVPLRPNDVLYCGQLGWCRRSGQIRRVDRKFRMVSLLFLLRMNVLVD